jgi:hypothetical protein
VYGTPGWHATPVQVASLDSVVAIASGWVHSLALKADGTVWAWGYNGEGELGDGTDTTRFTPVQVSGLASIIAITGADTHSLALRSDGTVWSWGGNVAGQLGDGTTTQRRTPVQVLGLAGVTSIAAGFRSSMALTSDGTVSTWGDNRFGMLGDGTAKDRSTAERILTLGSVTALSSGRYHCLALESDGTVWAWGQNSSGQLGDGTATEHRTPVQVTGVAGAVAIAAGREHSLALLQHIGTALYTVDRTGTVGEPVRLKAYLKRTTDNAWVVGRAVMFRVGGSDVGSAVTTSSGMAYLDWIITDGPTERTIAAEYAGDPQYWPSAAWAALTALTHETQLYVPNRSAEIADTVLLKAYLYWGPSHLPKLGKTVRFSVGGTAVGSAVTNEGGRAMVSYAVPEGAGAGVRPLVADWPGDGGYRASAASATLDVGKAPTYLWFASRSAQITKQTYLRAYLRRLPDYVWLPGKAVRFALDGTVLGSEATDAGGRASYLYTVSAALGDHPMVAAFDGDGSYLPGGGSAVLTVTP